MLENHANKANTETFARAGQAQRQCGNFCAAEHIVQQGLELHPDSLHLAQEYALTARDKKDWPQALLRWRMIIEHFQDKAPALAYSQLSKACRQLSKLDFAESTAEEGLSRYPDSMQLAMDYAEIAMSRRHWDTAVQRWQTILEQFGVNAGPRVFIRLAVAYRNMLDPGRAESIAENGLTAYPENMELLKIYSEIAMARRDWVQAVQRWQKVFDLFQVSVTHRLEYG